MKDKSRFISSVIVSLLAGFIYYQFGHGIEEKLQSSIKAVLSSNDAEQYLSPDCQPFNTITVKSDSKLNKKRSKYFIKKRNVIEFKTESGTIPGDELFSNYVSKQAKFQKSTADKNIDFTAELESLIKSDNSKTDLRQSKGFKIDRSNLSADINELSSRPERIQKNFEASEVGVYGYGFEYNYIITEQGNSTKIKVEKKKTNKSEGYNSYESYIPFQSYESFKNNETKRERVVNKVRVNTPPGRPTSAPEVHSNGCNNDKSSDMDDEQPEVIIPFLNGNDEDM